MALGIRKSRRFDPQSPIPASEKDPDPSGNPVEDQTAMEEVAGESANGIGGWFNAKCNSVKPGDNINQIGKIFKVYFALDENEEPIKTGSIAAAPCPPFCDGEASGVIGIIEERSVIGIIEERSAKGIRIVITIDPIKE